MIPRRYGVRLVRHLPGSALVDGKNRRWSAHSVTVNEGSGRIPAASPAQSEAARSLARCRSRKLRGRGIRKLCKLLPDIFLQQNE